jgi:glucose-6-phosphate isomerase
MVRVDLSGAQKFFTAAGPDYKLASLAHETLSSGTGLGADFTGWGSLPQHIKDPELDRIVAAAEKIRSRSTALVVIGIGGSYLGARGAIELLKPVPDKGDPRIFFVGNTLSADALCDTLR